MVVSYYGHILWLLKYDSNNNKPNRTNLNMSEMSNKKSLNNSVKESGTEGEVFSLGRYPKGKQHEPSCNPATARRKWSKEGNKMAILCYLQAKEGPNIGYRKKCINTRKIMDSLSWRNKNSLTKLGLL